MTLSAAIIWPRPRANRWRASGPEAPEQSDAPRAVDARHHGPGIAALDHDGVGVVRDVEHAHDGAQRSEPGGERDKAVRERRCDECGAEQRRAVADDATCAEPSHRERREAGSEKKPDREAGKRDPELARGDMRLRLDRRQARPERPCRDRVQDEGRDDAAPRRAEAAVAFVQRAVM